MKAPYVAGLVVLAVAITLAVEETRIASLRARLSAAESGDAAAAHATKTPETQASVAGADDAGASRPTKVQERPAGADKAPEEETDAGSFQKSVRKMWENPAGKAMLNQGAKVAVAMMYGDFLDSLDLSGEEAEYFRDLLGREIADQQEIGIKIMSATPEERMELVEELERRKTENEEAVRAFLNDDEDHKRFLDYKERLPERQQLDGLRTAMAGREAAMDGETEARLVNAMHRARTQSGARDLSGAEGMEALVGGNMAGDFEKSWAAQQNMLRLEVGEFLSAEQQEAFFEHQEQMKEFSLMGIRMAEKMMAPAGDGE